MVKHGTCTKKVNLKQGIMAHSNTFNFKYVLTLFLGMGIALVLFSRKRVAEKTGEKTLKSPWVMKTK
tara:strand:+ start:1546 stop:1746 length:201 start_codon:yes stop_codon:yes gene_type:complete